MKSEKKTKGLKASFFIYPCLVCIFIFQIYIIAIAISINIRNARLSDKTKLQSDINNDITEILSSTSKLSDTIIQFSHSPTIYRGTSLPETLSTGSLSAYYEQISIEDAKPEAIKNTIKSYDLSKDVNEKALNAISEYEIMINTHSHTFYLIKNALENKNETLEEDKKIDLTLLNNVISYLPEYELTSDEYALSVDDALKQAHELLFTSDYSINKGKISSDVKKAISIYTEKSKKDIDDYSHKLNIFRQALWILALLTMVVSVTFFILLLILFVFPIVKFSNNINEGKKLKISNKLYETNILATAYNDLIDKHADFEKKLRIVAEKDSLTGMPNRFSYNEFLNQKVTNEEKVCVFVLDINDLKKINDNYGHSEGDILIKNASLCISECFKNGDNCYRIGGDEFVAILKNIEEKEIKKYVSKFRELQKKYNVSIAIGFAYSTNILNDGYEKLIKIADSLMYEDKKAIKGKTIKTT